MKRSVRSSCSSWASQASLERRPASLAAALLLCGLSGAALAYIPSSGAMLRRAAARVSEGGRSREVTLTGTLARAGGAPQSAQLVLHFPLSCKFAGPGAAPPNSGATAGAATANTAPSADPAAASELLALACPLIAYRGQTLNEAERTLRAAAIAAGVDVSAATGLTRLSDRAAYILGADPHQPEKPQLWLYKDNNAPARLIDSKGSDLRLLQYGNPAAADWFPRVIELWQGGALSLRFEALEVKGFRDTAEEEDPDDARE